VKNPVFSIMKGVAILGVVLGHCCTYEFTVTFVNQWHLAVFFFVSGYFVREVTSVTEWKDATLKKIKHLYLPYISACVGCILLHNLFSDLHIHYNYIGIREILYYIYMVCVRLHSMEPMMGAMWFCPALLWVSIIACTTLWLKSKTHWIVLFLPFIVGSVCLHVLHLKSPYCIWQNSIVSGIFFLGYGFRKIEPRLQQMCMRTSWMQLLSCVLLGGILVSLTYAGIVGKVQPNEVNVENPFVIMVIAGIGIMMVYALALLVNTHWVGKVLQVTGDYSFGIMMLHFLCFRVVNLIMCWTYGLPVDSIASFPTIHHGMGWTIAFVLISIGLSICVSKMFDRIKVFVVEKYVKA